MGDSDVTDSFRAALVHQGNAQEAVGVLVQMLVLVVMSVLVLVLLMGWGLGTELCRLLKRSGIDNLPLGRCSKQWSGSEGDRIRIGSRLKRRGYCEVGH